MRPSLILRGVLFRFDFEKKNRDIPFGFLEGEGFFSNSLIKLDFLDKLKAFILQLPFDRPYTHV